MNGLGRNKEEKENKGLLFTKETFGVVIILFATLLLVCLITRDKVFSVPGLYVNSFLFGTFGFYAYAVVISLIVLGVLMVSGKHLPIKTKYKFLYSAFIILSAVISHIATCPYTGQGFGNYISTAYNMGNGGIATTSAGGAITSIIAYVFPLLLTSVGSYVVLGICEAVIVYLIILSYVKGDTKKPKKKENGKFRSSYVEEKGEDVDGVTLDGVKEYPVDDVDFSVKKGKQTLFINNSEDFGIKTKREINRDNENNSFLKVEQTKSGLNVGVFDDNNAKPVEKPQTETPAPADDMKKKLEYIKTPVSFDMNNFIRNTPVSSDRTFNSESNTTVSDYITPSRETPVKEDNNIPFIEHENSNRSQVVAPETKDSVQARAERFGNLYADIEETEVSSDVEEATSVSRLREGIFNRNVEPEKKEEPPVSSERSVNNFDDIPYIDETNEDEEINNRQVEPDIKEQPEQSNITTNRRLRDIFELDKNEEQAVNDDIAYTSRVEKDHNGSEDFSSRNRGEDLNSDKRRVFDTEDKENKPFERVERAEEKPVPEQEKKEEKPVKPPVPINRKYNRPPLDLLESYNSETNEQSENHEERMQIIQKTLEEFHINAESKSYVQGPSITRYEIMMPAGISVKRVLNLDDDLKMRLAAKEGVRIEAPIPGKNLVGVEVANRVKVTVGLKEVMENIPPKPEKGSELVFALGKDIVGKSVTDRLEKGPHYLVAGATGSGKSVTLHVMIVSLIMRYSPEELKLVLIDPKSVEFRKYEHLPHLLVDEIITEPKRAVALLQWAYEETNRRNDMFTECGGMISNIDDYNSIIANDKIPKLPRIVFVIDELADLMEACKKELEEKIRKVAAKSRSAGIHLVLATQRPSVDVITGTIKTNLPSRIALKVMSNADSMTILGMGGAEKLLGHGDMLYKNSSMSDFERYQGAFITGREIANVVDYIIKNNQAYFDEDVYQYLEDTTRPKQEEMAVSTSDTGGRIDEYDELFVKALKLGVSCGEISISQVRRRFQIGYTRAGGLIDKMERMGYVTGAEGSKARRVLLTKEAFVEKYGSFSDDDDDII